MPKRTDDYSRRWYDNGLVTTGLPTSVKKRVIEVLEYTGNLKAYEGNSELEGEVLSGIDFECCSLKSISFHHCSLDGSDLSFCYQLTPKQLRGADLSHASLPATTMKALEERLAYLSDLNRKIGLLEAILLPSLLVMVLVTFATDDVNFYTNTGSVPLPVINVPLSPIAFVQYAPLIPIGLFLWVQFYVHQYWKTLSELPAVFPDGVPLTMKGAAWLGAEQMKNYFPRLKPYSDAVSFRGAQLLIAFIYLMTPLMVGLVGWRCFVLHDWGLSGWHLALFASCTVGTYLFYKQAFAFHSYREATAKPVVWWQKIGRYEVLTALAVVGAMLCSHNDIDGWQWMPTTVWMQKHLPLLAQWHYPRNVIFDGKNVSLPPDGWAQPDAADMIPPVGDMPPLASEQWTTDTTHKALAKQNPELMRVKPALLDGRDFKGLLQNVIPGFAFSSGDTTTTVTFRNGLLAKDAMLTNARLRNARLCGADLTQANLQNAIITDADLRQSDLTRANLQYANLVRANFGDNNPLWAAKLVGLKMQFANAEEAHLQNTDLSNADCSYAQLARADFTGATLGGAVFRYADLSGAKWKNINEDLRPGKLMPYPSSATYIPVDDGYMITSKWTPIDATGAILTDVSFENTVFPWGGIFDQADLSRADFKYAYFGKSSFIGANLSGVQNLRTAELDGVVFDSSTRWLNEETKPPYTFPKELERYYYVEPVENMSMEVKPKYKGKNVYRLRRKPIGHNFTGEKHKAKSFAGYNYQNSLMNWTDLTGANFKDADMRWSQFVGATLTNAKNIKTAKLDNVIFDANTVWPHGTLEKETEILKRYKPVQLEADDWENLKIDPKYLRQPQKLVPR